MYLSDSGAECNSILDQGGRPPRLNRTDTNGSAYYNSSSTVLSGKVSDMSINKIGNNVDSQVSQDISQDSKEGVGTSEVSKKKSSELKNKWLKKKSPSPERATVKNDVD